MLVNVYIFRTAIKFELNIYKNIFLNSFQRATHWCFEGCAAKCSIRIKKPANQGMSDPSSLILSYILRYLRMYCYSCSWCSRAFMRFSAAWVTSVKDLTSDSSYCTLNCCFFHSFIGSIPKQTMQITSACVWSNRIKSRTTYRLHRVGNDYYCIFEKIWENASLTWCANEFRLQHCFIW
jgi:hypothetical protein